MLEFMRDPKTGIHMAFIKPVFVCPICGIEAPVVLVVEDLKAGRREETYQCPVHPDAVLIQHHHMVPDPCSVDPNRDYGWQASRQHNDGKPDLWKANYERNRELITGRTVSAATVPTAKVVYLVGSGPSLGKNVQQLMGVRTGAIVALNDSLRGVTNHNPGVDKYFFAVDFIFDRIEAVNVGGWTAVLPPICAPKLPRLPWKDLLWIRSGVHCAVLDEIYANHGGLWKYYEGLNCTYAAVQFILQALKPEKIVLVGMDCGFTGGHRHVDEKLKWEPGYIVEYDGAGGPCISNDMMKSQRDYLFAQLFFAQLAGVQTVNCTEGGTMPEAMTVRVAPRGALAEVVKLNEASYVHTEGDGRVDVRGGQVQDKGGGKAVVPGVPGKKAQSRTKKKSA